MEDVEGRGVGRRPKDAVMKRKEKKEKRRERNEKKKGELAGRSEGPDARTRARIN